MSKTTKDQHRINVLERDDPTVFTVLGMIGDDELLIHVCQ